MASKEELQAAEDREKLLSAPQGPLAAYADVMTLPVRGLMGAANTVLRVPNAFGASIPYIPEAAFGGDSASLTPFYDRLRRSRGEVDPTGYNQPGRFAPNDGPQAPAASPTSDTIAALEAMIRMSGGRGRGGSLGLDVKALNAADAKDQALMDGALAHLRASRGAVSDSIRARAVPEVFDAAGEDARIRAANPFTKKERTNVFALPMWDAKSNSFVQNPNAVAGAKHLADVGTEEQTLHDKRLAQLLGFGREAVTGRNLQQTVRDTNAIEANKVNMPTELDMGLIKQGMKGDTARAMAVARMNAAAMSGGKDDAITQMLRAYKNKAEAEKSGDPKLVTIADKVIEMLSPKKTAEKVDPRLVEESRTSLNNMLGKKSNTPLGEVIMRDFQQNVMIDPAGALRIAREQMDSAGTKKP